MKNVENLCSVVIILSMLIVSGCIGSEMVEELNYKHYPLQSMGGALILNNTEVININYSEAEAKLKSLNYSWYMERVNNNTSFNFRIFTTQNTTDFKHGGVLVVWLVAYKNNTSELMYMHEKFNYSIKYDARKDNISYEIELHKAYIKQKIHEIAIAYNTTADVEKLGFGLSYIT